MATFHENFKRFRDSCFELGIFKDTSYEPRRWGSKVLKKEIKEASSDTFTSFEEKIWALLNDTLEKPVCAVCGGRVNIKGISVGFFKTCSNKCAANDPDRKSKTENTIKKRYNGKHFTQDEVWIKNFVQHCRENGSYKKGQETFKKKYGVENRYQLESVKTQIKKTNLERYGAESAMQNEDIKNKVKSTTLDLYGNFYNPVKARETVKSKYGVDNVLQDSAIKAKVKSTTLDRHGAFFNPVKAKQTMIRQYGVEHALQVQAIKDQARLKHKETIFNRTIARLSGIVNPNFNKEDFTNCDREYSWKCAKCGGVFSSHLSNGKTPRCFSCYPTTYDGLSNDVARTAEKIFQLKSSKNRRDLIDGLEIDIYFDELKLGIEVNGIYWHSAKFKDRLYHQKKTLTAAQKGIRLIHIFEDDWYKNQNVFINQLNLIRGNGIKIPGRKCDVREISFREADALLSTHHLNGSGSKTNVCIGLFHGNELVSVATFGKPRFNKSYQWELIRYCTLPGMIIVGGLSKLINAFSLKLKPSNLMTYADYSWSTGNGYLKTGFELVKLTSPGYFYVSWDNKVFTRYESTKKILNKKLRTTDLTETEAAEKLKLHKIWDCGNLLFVKNFM